MDIQHMAGTVNHGRGVTAIVLENFQSISLARKHLWTWEQITGALREQYPECAGLSRGAVQVSFKRIERGIKAKRIKPVGRVIDDQAKAPKPTAPAPVKSRQTLAIPARTSASRTGEEIISQAPNFTKLG